MSWGRGYYGLGPRSPWAMFRGRCTDSCPGSQISGLFEAGRKAPVASSHHQVERPAAAGVWTWATQVPKQVGVVTAGGFY